MEVFVSNGNSPCKDNVKRNLDNGRRCSTSGEVIKKDNKSLKKALVCVDNNMIKHVVHQILSSDKLGEMIYFSYFQIKDCTRDRNCTQLLGSDKVISDVIKRVMKMSTKMCQSTYVTCSEEG